MAAPKHLKTEGPRHLKRPGVTTKVAKTATRTTPQVIRIVTDTGTVAGKKGVGISGSAVLLGTVGLYLVYVGIKKVPFLEGLRLLLKGQSPESLSQAKQSDVEPLDLQAIAAAVAGAGPATTGVTTGPQGVGKDTGIERLVGNAAAAYPVLKRRFPGLVMNGWRSTGSVPGSDHPKGLAIDVMTPHNNVAQAVIMAFRGTTGAKYWIWNTRIATKSGNWVPRSYSGPSPHTDHVHLSWS